MRRLRMRVALWAALGLVATAGVVSQGISASATTCTGKCALGTGVPSSVGAGSTTTITFSLKNEANPQSIGSADLTVPSGFVIPPGQNLPAFASISSDGTTLVLRSLGLAPGATATVAFQVTAPCTVPSTTWSLIVKQANNFSGPPGNNFAIDSSSTLTTTVIGSCFLSFSAEPTNAVFSTNITSQGFNPSAAPVAVEAEDGQGHPVSGVTVTLSLLPAGNGATLSGTLSGTTDSGGMATFGSSASPLVINQTGYYQLQASAAGFPSAQSSGFQITSTAQVCSSNPCTTPFESNSRSDGATATAINEASTDLLSLGLGGFSYSCPGYQSVSQPIGTDVWTSTGPINPSANAQVILEIFKATVKQSPNNGVASFQICYASTAPFSSSTGTTSIPGPDPTKPITVYFGLLPDCGNTTPVPVPCVVSRHKDNAGNVLITYDGTGDFWGQG